VNLDEYFTATKGRGILATADKKGKVNLALYARPYFVDQHTVAFIMAERLSHANLIANPRAAYLFTEEEWKSQGKRLYLKKIKEEKNPDLLEKICRKCDYSGYEVGNQYIVYFKLENTLPLVSGELI
jgi:hypothetical protein